MWTTLGLLIITAIVTLTVTVMTEAICIKCASDVMKNGKASLLEAFSFTGGKIGTIVAVVLLAAIITASGFVALIVPGVILAIMYALATPTVINENTGILDSLLRSRELVHNRWLETLVLLPVTAVAVLLTTFVAGLIVAPLGSYSWVASGAVSALVGPMIPTTVAVHYHLMLAKERAQMPPPPPF